MCGLRECEQILCTTTASRCTTVRSCLARRASSRPGNGTDDARFSAVPLQTVLHAYACVAYSPSSCSCPAVRCKLLKNVGGRLSRVVATEPTLSRKNASGLAAGRSAAGGQRSLAVCSRAPVSSRSWPPIFLASCTSSSRRVGAPSRSYDQPAILVPGPA